MIILLSQQVYYLVKIQVHNYSFHLDIFNYFFIYLLLADSHIISNSLYEYAY